MSYNPSLAKLEVLSAAAAGSVVLPISGYITSIVVTNTTANVITGGLKFGTTSGGVDIIATLGIGANALAFITDALFLKRIFSVSATQTIFYDAVTLWNSAVVNINIFYYQL